MLLKWLMISFCCIPALSHGQGWHGDLDMSVGMTAGGYRAKQPDVQGAELGAFFYTEEYLSLNGSLVILGQEHLDDLLAGLSFSIRAEYPGRISPFVGVGAFGGYNRVYKPAFWDGFDNDRDGVIDEPGEWKKEVHEIMGSVYPEAGVHLWLNKKFRLTFNAAYHYSTLGRDSDYFGYGIHFGYLFD